MAETLRGTVERITYHNEENGYTVAQLMPEGNDYTVTVVGNMLGVNVGESVAVTGAWMAHAQYGRQFKSEQVRTVLPATIAGLERYLGSGLIKGVGPVMAGRIVRKFGLDTLRIIEDDPARLREVLGVGRKRADIITRAWAEQQKIKEVMIFLQGHNISTGLAVRIYKQYGDDALAVVQADPYRLAQEVYGIGFITADKIARELGIAEDAPERVAAGVAYTLSQAADDGSVYLPEAELSRRACELLGVPPRRSARPWARWPRPTGCIWKRSPLSGDGADLLAGRGAPRLSHPVLLRRGGRQRAAAPADGCARRPDACLPGVQLARRLRHVAGAEPHRPDAAADGRGAGRALQPRGRADGRAGHGQDDHRAQHHPAGRGDRRADRRWPRPPGAPPNG